MNYCEVYYQNKEHPIICYRTGLTVYEEKFYKGTLCPVGWNVAGYPLNVLNAMPTRINIHSFGEPSSFKIEVDGICLDYGWKLVSFDKNQTENGIDAVMVLENECRPIRATIHTLLDGTNFFDRYIEITNLSDEPHTVNKLELIGGPLEQMDKGGLTDERDIDKYYSLGYFENYGWGREGLLKWEDIKPEIRAFDTRFNRDRFRHPVMFIRNNIKGTIMCVQPAYSGGVRFSVDYKARKEDNVSFISFGCEINGYKPMLVLRPNETFKLPTITIGMVSGGIDEISNGLHLHTRRSVLNVEGTESACLVGAGMGPEHDMLMGTTMNYIDQFHKMGAEVFIIDAGWQCPPVMPVPWGDCNGINRPDPDRYPDDGFAKLREYCHSIGMKFGIWTEIERLGCYSPVFKEHPEWRNNNKFGDKHGGYLDLTNPEALAWAESEIERFVSEYKLDLFRVDYNFGSEDSYFLMKDTGFGIKECVTLRNMTAANQMYLNLKKKFPNVIFENCAGGGGRTDYGQIKAFNHTWVSDWQRAPHSVTISNGMSIVIPPEKMDRLFAGMGCHEFGSLDLQMRNALLGHLTLNVINPPDTTINSDALEFIQHSIGIYKDFIRKILPGCMVYHHTPDVAETYYNTHFSAIEIASPDKKRAALTAFTLSGAKENVFTVYPKGIDPSLDYKVTLDNLRRTFVMSGAELINVGLRLNIPTSLSSELVLFEAN